MVLNSISITVLEGLILAAFLTFDAGRYFQKQQGSKVYLQAKFNADFLSTTPADLSAAPLWDTQLCWEINSKPLSFLRSQRQSIKLLCYAIDNKNRRDTLGYVMLDLRAASSRLNSVEKWYPLINSKASFGAFRPEVKLAFAITPIDQLDGNFQQQQSIQRSPRLAASFSQNFVGATSQSTLKKYKNLIVLPNQIYQIGKGDEEWTLNIAIAFATALDILLPFGNSETSYHFSLKFLETKFETLPFFDLVNPIFSVEQVEIKLKGKINDISNFLVNEIVNLKILLLGGGGFGEENILGSSQIPLKDLISSSTTTSTKNNQSEFILEKVYDFLNKKNELPISHDSKVPNIGLSIKLTPLNPTPPPPLPKNEPPTTTNQSSLLNQQHQQPEETPTLWHQYKLTLTIHSILSLSTQPVFAQYIYPPLIPTPITTPSTPINSTHVVEFVIGKDRLEMYFEAVPLQVEVCGLDGVVFGSAAVDLRGSGEFLVDVFGVGRDLNRKVGEVSGVVFLEDFGVVDEDRHMEILEDQQQQQQQIHPNIQKTNLKTTETNDNVWFNNHQNQEYKAAFEHEIWKKEEEQKFLLKLENKEQEILKNLTQEYNQRDQKRAQILTTKLADFKHLESKIQNLVLDLDKRDETLARQEEALERSKMDLEREYGRKVDETRDASRRLHEEYRHHLELEKKKTLQLEIELKRVVVEKDGFEERYRKLEGEVLEFKMNLNQTPEVVLKGEILKCQNEKLSLVKKMDSLENAKKHYKTQWIKSLKELAKVKKIRLLQEEELVSKERREVESMKIKQLAKDDIGAIRQDESILKELKKELQELRTRTVENAEFNKNIGKKNHGGMQWDDDENFDPNVINEVERLVRERDSLLRTGVYSADDLIVSELDRRVRQLLQKK